MRKETFNSFAKGMSKDYNPLVVGKESYTDCLNGTLITYNGNEMSLQNDMGNAEIGTAFLPEGYVPVGMKEYGGIIYVAAYNPAENKSQIGCFPSPQQIFVDNGVANLDVSLSLDEILDNVKIYYPGTEDIKEETKTEPKLISKNLVSSLLYGQEDNTYRTFYVGDQFIVALPQDTLDSLAKYITDGVILFKLAVITESGNIEYIDDSKLKTYTNSGSWIYSLSDTETLDTVITKDENMQVFRGNSSGKLMIVLMYKVCNNFEVSRKYEYVNDSDLQITFTGKYDGVSNSILYKREDELSFAIEKESYAIIGNNIINYEIYPGHTVYGYEKALGVSGSIDIDMLKKQQSMLSNVYYYVEEEALRLHWSYDYIDINNLQPSCINFKFYDLAKASLTGEGGNRKVTLPTEYHTYTVIKDSYNGDFTDRIPFSRGTFDENTVYYCEIEECKEGSNPKLIQSLFIYTGKYFNLFDLQQLNNYIEGNTPQDSIAILPEVTFNCTESSSSDKVYVNKNKVHNSSTNNLYDEDGSYESSMFEEVANGNLNLFLDNTYIDDDCVFITKVLRHYTLNPKITVNTPEKIDANGVIFNIDDLVFNTSYISNETVKYNLQTPSIIDNIETVGTGTTYLPNASSTGKLNSNGSFDIDLNRNIWAKGADDRKLIEVERLMPYYDEISGYASDEDRSKVFGFREIDNGYITCIAATDKMLYHNSKLQTQQMKKSQYKEVKGGECGGCDEAHLSTGCAEMGGTINLLGGTDGDESSYRVVGRDIARDVGYAWGNDTSQKDSEVDPGDNYLLTCWKQSDTDYKLLNLGSRKYYDVNSGDGVPERHNIQSTLRCICSLILVAKTFDMYQDFVKPDVANLAYHKNFETEVLFTYKRPDDATTILVDSELHSILDALSAEKDIANYIPKFFIDNVSDVSFTYKLGSNFEIDNYIDKYQQTQFTVALHETLKPDDRRKAHLGVVTSIDDRGICQLKTDKYGRYEINSQNLYFTYWISLCKDKTSIGFSPCLWFGYNGNIALTIDTIFITRADQLQQYNTRLPKDFYNELCLKEGAVKERVTSKFVKHDNEHAPDMHLLPLPYRKTTDADILKLTNGGDKYSIYTNGNKKMLRHLFIYKPEK